MQPFLANNNHLPILDGDKALELAKKMVIRIIKDNIPTIGHDVAGISLGHKDTAATNTYKQAAKNILIT